MRDIDPFGRTLAYALGDLILLNNIDVDVFNMAITKPGPRGRSIGIAFQTLLELSAEYLADGKIEDTPQNAMMPIKKFIPSLNGTEPARNQVNGLLNIKQFRVDYHSCLTIIRSEMNNNEVKYPYPNNNYLIFHYFYLHCTALCYALTADCTMHQHTHEIAAVIIISIFFLLEFFLAGRGIRPIFQ